MTETVEFIKLMKELDKEQQTGLCLMLEGLKLMNVKKKKTAN